MWRCGSCTRTRGNASPRCGRPFPTSACRCCCVAATPSATPLTRTRWRVRSSPRRPTPGSISSGSSTRSTTSTRCAPRSTRSGTPARRSPKSRCAYTGDLSNPNETLYTLDYYLKLARTGRRCRRAHPGDQGHGRVVAGPGGGDVGHRAAEQFRSAGARAHPRHPRWSVGDLRGGVAGRRRRRRRSIGGDGGHHAVSRRSRRSSPRRPTPSTTPG